MDESKKEWGSAPRPSIQFASVPCVIRTKSIRFNYVFGDLSKISLSFIANEHRAEPPKPLILNNLLQNTTDAGNLESLYIYL